MNNREEVIGYGELELVSPFKIETLHNLRIEHTINDHARCYISGTIPENMKKQSINQINSKEPIELYRTKNGNRVRPLFKGYLADVSIRVVRGVHQIELEIVSSTFQMDTKPVSRSFQNVQMTYHALMKKVLENYPSSDVIDTVSKSTKLSKFILQYEETDWQFLKRMASHFESILVPNLESKHPKFWFGLPEGKKVDLPLHMYTVIHDRNSYLETLYAQPTKPIAEKDMYKYVIESNMQLSIGDRVSMQNRELVVMTVISRMDKGLLTYEYHLMPEAGIRQRKMFIPNLTGIAIEGKVLEIQQSQVRLHLSIDPTQPKEEAFWFPFATPYAAEGHSGFHMAPEVGDTMQLAFSNHQEESAVAQRSLRKGGATNPKMADSNTRYLGNASGKEAKLDGQSVTLTAKEGAIFLKVVEGQGIEFHSEQPLQVTSNQDITVNGKSITLTATESIFMMCRSSSLVLDGNTDIQGITVEMEGLNKSPVSISNSSSNSNNMNNLQLALDVDGMIPSGGGADV